MRIRLCRFNVLQDACKVGYTLNTETAVHKTRTIVARSGLRSPFCRPMCTEYTDSVILDPGRVLYTAHVMYFIQKKLFGSGMGGGYDRSLSEVGLKQYKRDKAGRLKKKGLFTLQKEAADAGMILIYMYICMSRYGNAAN
jgi:hypothetical protein